MKKWILWTALATIIFAVIVHIAVVAYVPYKVMDIAMNQRFQQYPKNTLLPAPPTMENSRSVVRSSPDILYSICMYDVSQKPLLFDFTIPEGYWSASFYADNTDNFFVINDRQVKTKWVKVLLLGRDVPEPPAGDAIVVRAMSNRGLALVRMIVPDEQSLPALIEAQKKSSCKLLD